MIRNYKNYNIQQGKDGRYTVSITDHGHRTYFYGRTKKEVQQKLEVFVAELNNAAQLQYELNNPTKYMSLKNWAYICLNNYRVASIQGNTYISYERFIQRMILYSQAKPTPDLVPKPFTGNIRKY